MFIYMFHRSNFASACCFWEFVHVTEHQRKGIAAQYFEAEIFYRSKDTHMILICTFTWDIPHEYISLGSRSFFLTFKHVRYGISLECSNSK